ncbi:MAG: hypothetical protein KJ757_07145 [Planctomycetes bacterium]|nr:hypothetical protein [Planctomycetota bacterium]
MEDTIFTSVVNREKAIEAIADNYKTKIDHDLWLAEGLQKDAVQNSWDARIDKKHGENWECGFSLIKIKNKEILCISDKGTIGLNGTKFYTQNELAKILEKISDKGQSNEDLACFLNSDWSGKSIEEGGNRGRGKTLFLVASDSKKVFFESLRSFDNVYVFGELYLDSADKQVKFRLYYDKNGMAKFKSEFGEKIDPISQCGTKIFIVNPDNNVAKAIREGEMLSFISNSRWETIKKYDAKIFVYDGREKKYATIPHWYENNLKERGIKEKEIGPEIIKEGTQYKTKRLVLRYAPSLNVPDSISGIAVQRGGMTIERISAEKLVKEQGVMNIYGWLEMESKKILEEEMKVRCEGPEHFNFSWNLNPARHLRNYIQRRIREFANDLKLVESEQAEKNKIQRSAGEKASKNLAPFFKKLGLSGKHKGGRRKKRPFRRKINWPLRLSASTFELPHESRRVNYGDKIRGTYVVPINDFDRSFMVLVRLFVVSDDGRTKVIEEKQVNLYPGNGPEIGTKFINIEKKYHKKGGYSFKARMLCLEDTDRRLPDKDKTKIEKGTILYEINQKFYVETDPPESGPFRFQSQAKEDKDNLFEWEEEDGGGYVIYYNELHPKIKPFIKDEERLADYLTEQGALLALQITFEEMIAEGDDRDKDFFQLIKAKNKNLEDVLPLFLKKYSEFLWDHNLED